MKGRNVDKSVCQPLSRAAQGGKGEVASGRDTQYAQCVARWVVADGRCVLHAYSAALFVWIKFCDDHSVQYITV